MPKRLGLIGGVSPESTVIYYRLLNAMARDRLGGHHSADLLLAALSYGEMLNYYERKDWDAFKARVAAAAINLRDGGAAAIVITSNTTQMAAEAARDASGLPLIHLLDALADTMRERRVSRPLLLGTPFTMTGHYYRAALAERYHSEILIPDDAGQAETSRVIFDELVEGVVRDASRQNLLHIVDEAKGRGADGVILGCTELCMILDETFCDMPVLDTTAIHARAAHEYAFSEGR